jgi:hypothetical protein
LEKNENNLKISTLHKVVQALNCTFGASNAYADWWGRAWENIKRETTKACHDTEKTIGKAWEDVKRETTEGFKKVTWNSKLFFGYGRVNFDSTVRSGEDKRIIYPRTIKKSIDCFIADLSVGMKYLFTKRFGAGVDVGYRYMPEIVLSKSDDVKIDLSGMTVALNLSYKV